VADKRKKIWIDRFQSRLVVRIALYFALYQSAVWSLIVLKQAITNGLDLLFGNSPITLYFSILCIAIVVVMGLLFIRDSLIVAHRIVGPLYRFRKAIKAVTAGDELELVRLREGDYLQELKQEFNEMLKVLELRGAVTLTAVKKTAPDHSKAGLVCPSPCASLESAPVV
jgi:hypothetical protein